MKLLNTWLLYNPNCLFLDIYSKEMKTFAYSGLTEDYSQPLRPNLENIR